MIGARFVSDMQLFRQLLWAYPMELLGDVGQVEARSVSLETMLISVQDRCLVWDERTIISETILGTPDGTPRSLGSNRSLFSSIWR
jgi:hypothetical protein